jgi:hypothetical protein
MQKPDPNAKLQQCMTDMLIFLYNGKPTSDFRENYANVAQLLD